MMRIWHNGKIVKDKVSLRPDDRGLALGDGVFETLAVKDGVALWRFEHLQRMQNSAQIFGLALSHDDVETAIDALTAKAKGSHVLRLTLTRGQTARGLATNGKSPTLIASLEPFNEALRFVPVKLATVATRRNLYSMTAQHKTLSYLDHIIAAREAQLLGAEDGLMLNTAGRLASTTMANIFIETDKGLTTPALTEGILPGIMRAEVIRLARLGQIPVREKRVTKADLASAHALFTSNSLRFIRPVTQIDGRMFQTPTALFKLLQQGLRNAEWDQL